MGGGELARDFLKDDVVDELYIGIVPVLIGEGLPLFPVVPPTRIHPPREQNLLERHDRPQICPRPKKTKKANNFGYTALTFTGQQYTLQCDPVFPMR